jgi:hypothetical protein
MRPTRCGPSSPALDELLARDSSLNDVVSCQPDLLTNPLTAANAAESNPTEEFDGPPYRLEDKPDDHDFKRNISIKDLAIDRSYSEADNCIHLDSNNQMLRAEEDQNCGIFESGSDHTQLVSILTISIITTLAFAAVPFTWLIYRYHRPWRLGALAFAGSEASHSRSRRRRTGLPPLVAVPPQRVSSSSRGRHRHGLRKRVRVLIREDDCDGD